MVGGCKLGMDVRLCAPRPSLAGSMTWLRMCSALAEETGARLTLTDDVAEGVKGADYLYTDVWVSMGEPDSVWEERINLLKPYQVNAQAMELTGNPKTKFLHCLPAFHNAETKVGQEMAAEIRPAERPGSHRRCISNPPPPSSLTRPKTACIRSRPSWSPRWGTNPTANQTAMRHH